MSAARTRGLVRGLAILAALGLVEGAWAEPESVDAVGGRLYVAIQPAQTQNYDDITFHEAELEAVLAKLESILRLRQDAIVLFADELDTTPPAGVTAIFIGYDRLDELRDQRSGPVWFAGVKQDLFHEIARHLLQSGQVTTSDANVPDEAAADQLAFFLMAEAYDAHTKHSALDPVVSHLLAPAAIRGEDAAQRVEDTLCWIDGMTSLFDFRLRPVLGDRDCEREYIQLSAAWNLRLDPVLYASADGAAPSLPSVDAGPPPTGWLRHFGIESDVGASPSSPRTLSTRESLCEWFIFRWACGED